MVRDNSPKSLLQESYLELRQGTTSHLAAALSESSRMLESLYDTTVSREEPVRPFIYDTSGFVDTPAVCQTHFCDFLDQMAQPRMPVTPRSPGSARLAPPAPMRKAQRPPSHFYRQFREAMKPAVEFDFRNL